MTVDRLTSIEQRANSRLAFEEWDGLYRNGDVLALCRVARAAQAFLTDELGAVDELIAALAALEGEQA